ncbi:GTPase IMAP family member 4-like [Megalops cyprinoides]|uniref:GTPase IMAP family member 4-like n=1 Tax=Megalops cyprinoides TaxID=118141 RepID=UPI0018648ECC|nr:GTPase IMAP family member 4-like [Megalops cyprinoides]
MNVLDVIFTEKGVREAGRDTAVTARSSILHKHGQSVALSDVSGLRIILLGERESGRSAVGNAILGREAFDAIGVKTRQSIGRRGMVAGRQLTVVDTPGWEWFPFHCASWGVKGEIARSVSLCPPGPHALLLVVPLSFSFTDRERMVAEEHLELFGEGAWRHALVVFTVRAGRLKDSTIEEEIEENEDLQRLVERCGNRFHVLHSRPRRGHDAVAELLAKIENMVAENGGEVIPSEEVLKEAKEREEVQARRKEVEEKEREEELLRVKEALKVLELEEGTEGEQKEEEKAASAVPRMREKAEHGVSADMGLKDSTEEPQLTSGPRTFGLRASFQRSCRTQ